VILTPDHADRADRAGVPADAITICTVVLAEHRPYFRESVEAVTSLGGADGWRWIVVDNSQNGLEGFFPCDDARFVAIPGAESRKVGRRSYHHAAGLHLALPLVRTRFLLILDPDFYILRPNWLRDIPAHMDRNNLAFFGAPWHPRWSTKYRYFPSVHCLFVDLNQVPLADLDFMPDIPQLLRPKTGEDEAERRPGWLSRFTIGVAKVLVSLLPGARRRRVSASRDTGWHVFARFGHADGVHHETVQPVVRFAKDFRGAKPHLGWALGRSLERLFPERLRYLPGEPGYYSLEGFKESGWPDASGEGWEEHMWNGAPFGAHFRKSYHDRLTPDRDRSDDLALVRRLVRTAATLKATGISVGGMPGAGIAWHSFGSRP
jgi:hypothetical protein